MFALGIFLPVIAGILAPLPKDVPALTAIYENRQQLVKLKWQHTDPSITSYELQSSMDNNTWLPVQVTKARQLPAGALVSFIDHKVEVGKNYYRLKVTRAASPLMYGNSIMVIIGNPGHSWLMYPVPVGNLLNLQYNGNELIAGVIGVFIQHINGRIFHQLRYASSTRHIQIPVDNLGSGIYDLRIVINNKTVWNQRFVK